MFKFNPKCAKIPVTVSPEIQNCDETLKISSSCPAGRFITKDSPFLAIILIETPNDAAT